MASREARADLRHTIRKVANDPLLNAMTEQGKGWRMIQGESVKQKERGTGVAGN